MTLRQSDPAERGMILVTVILLLVVLSLIGVSLSQLAVSQYTTTNASVFAANATMTAEAGIEQSLNQLNQNVAFTGYATAQEFFNDPVQGRGVFTTTINNTADSNAKLITSTAKVYRYNVPTEVMSTKLIRATVVGTSSNGYSVYTGVGGLILSGSGSIANSDVYVNGKITMTGSAKIGTPNQPVKVFAAHQACPSGSSPGPTYAEVCSDGSEPISLQQNTFIYGTVCATGQTSTGPHPDKNIRTGNGGEGLKVGCVAPPAPTPTYDRVAHINRSTVTSTSTDNAYVCNSAPFNRTWPATLRLNGNVSLGSSCNIVIKGDVYISGNLTLGGAARITVDDSLGATRPVIVVDGKITTGGSAQLISNASGTGIQFISYKSSAACGPTCTSLTGNDLKTSQSLETISIGGNVNLPGMIFHAYWGKLKLNGSGKVGAALGQTVDMSGSGTVTFGTTLSSGSTTWTVTSYQELRAP